MSCPSRVINHIFSNLTQPKKGLSHTETRSTHKWRLHFPKAISFCQSHITALNSVLKAPKSPCATPLLFTVHNFNIGLLQLFLFQNGNDDL